MYDPWKRKRPENPAQTRTLTDGDGGELTLTLRRLDVGAEMRAWDRAEELIAEYLTGNEAEGTPPIDFPPLASGDVILREELSESLFRICALIETMQPERVYSALDLVAISFTANELYRKILTFRKEVGVGKDRPNVTGTATDISSLSPSENLNGTRNLSVEPMPSSGASTSV